MHRPSLQRNVLFLCKNQGIKAVVIEERVSDADFSEGSAHEVLSMTKIGPVIDPPVDGTLAIERRIIAIDILGHRPGNVARVFYSRLWRRAIRTCVDVELMTGDVICVSLCSLSKQWVDRIRRQAFRGTVGIDGGNDLRQFLTICGVGAGGGGDIGAAARCVCGQGAGDSHCR